MHLKVRLPFKGTGEIGCQNQHDVQQKQVQSPALHALGQAGNQLRMQLWRVGPEGPHVHQVEHEPPMDRCSKESQQYPGLHWECCQQAERGDPSPLLFTGETHLECWIQVQVT